MDAYIELVNNRALGFLAVALPVLGVIAGGVGLLVWRLTSDESSEEEFWAKNLKPLDSHFIAQSVAYKKHAVVSRRRFYAPRRTEAQGGEELSKVGEMKKILHNNRGIILHDE